MKNCKGCQIEKTKENTYQDKRGYFSPYCKECNKKRSAIYKEKNLEKVRKSNRDYARKNNKKRSEYQKKYCEENKELIAKKAKEYWSKEENKKEKLKEKENNIKNPLFLK